MIAFLAFAGMTNAQKADLVGSWLMTKAEVNGKVETPYFITEFKHDGHFLIMGMDFGTWIYDNSDNSIQMTSEMDKDFNGKSEVLMLTPDELIVNKDKVKLTYKRIDIAQIKETNHTSGLMGIWEFKNMHNTNANTMLTFSPPDEFVMIEKDEYSTATIHGTWIFNPHEQSLIIIGMNGDNIFKGKNNVITLSDDAIELENNGKIFKAQRKTQNTKQVARLTFTETDFYTEDGDYKYEADADKLPWQDPLEMMMSLANIKHLIYNCAALVENTNSFENKKLTADVNSNPQEQMLSIDYIFYGYDSYNLPDDTALPPNEFDAYNKLYPEQNNSFRVVGFEQITTRAGSFDCTIVEAVGNGDSMKRMWMINDKPGIYAKIIEDNPDETFGHYIVYELQEIQ